MDEDSSSQQINSFRQSHFEPEQMLETATSLLLLVTQVSTRQPAVMTHECIDYNPI